MKGGETMEQLSYGMVCEIPFSRRVTLHQIWAELDKKYPKLAAKITSVKKESKKRV